VSRPRANALSVAAGLAAAGVAFAAVALATDDDGGRRPVTAGAPAAVEGESASGRDLFARMGCGSCHRLAAAGSTGEFGPDLDVQLAGHTRESLKAKILSPGGMMPANFGERMNAAELSALVEFLLAARRTP
jgi:mono/diheme cytochrome c family protein